MGTVGEHSVVLGASLPPHRADEPAPTTSLAQCTPLVEAAHRGGRCRDGDEPRPRLGATGDQHESEYTQHRDGSQRVAGGERLVGLHQELVDPR